MNPVLSKDEKELLESVERGEWKSIPNLKKEIKRYQEYAKAKDVTKRRLYLET